MINLSEDQTKLIKVTDALDGIVSMYPVEQVGIYPFIDVMHLLIQEPLVFSFFSGPNRDNRIYSSLADLELEVRFQESIKREDIERDGCRISPIGWCCLHKIDTSLGIENAKFKSYQHPLFKLLTDTFAESTNKQAVLDRIAEGLQHTYSQTEDNFPLEERISDLSNVDSALIDSLLQPMRRVLDEACADVMNSPTLRRILNGSPKELPFLNLFCVIRIATNTMLRRNCFNYTARLILSKTQKSQIIQWIDSLGARSLGYNNGEEFCEHLEFPLGTDARSIADSVFCSGVIDFSTELTGEGRDHVGAGETPGDNNRRVAESHLYKGISEDAHPFYIPIHVNGVPWLALFTLNPKEISWEHNYQVYRTLIPQIAGKLRTEAKDVYLNLIRETLVEELKTLDATLLNRVNKRWKLMTYVYPFDGLKILETKQNNTELLELPDGRQVWVAMYKNPSYARQINYNRLGLSECLEACRNAVNQIRLQRAELDHRFRAQLLSQRHTIFNRLPLTLDTLENTLSCDSNELSGTARIWVEDTRRATEILNVSLWIAFKEGEGRHPLRRVLSIIGLLYWFKEKTLSSEIKPILSIANDTPEGTLEAKELSDAFTVLWNLWHNASKIYPFSGSTDFHVTASRRSDDLVVTFVNEGIMPDDWVNYLLDKKPSPSNRDDPTGLEIVKLRMEYLGWRIDQVKVEKGQTHIAIVIPNRIK